MAHDRDEILRRAELARKELRALAEEPLPAQAKQRVAWVLHDLEVIAATALQEILADDGPATRSRRQRSLLG
jgi:hypothetical protein